MASVWRRSSHRSRRDKPWQITFRSFELRDGRWVQVSRTVTGSCDKEASRRLAMELEERSRRRRWGLIDPARERVDLQQYRSLADHLAEYAVVLSAKGDTARHVAEVRSILSGAAVACGFGSLAEVSASALSAHLQRLSEAGRSDRTLLKHRSVWRGFTRWACSDGRLGSDPLLSLPARRQTSKAVRRRAMSDDEAQALIEAASRAGPFPARPRRGRPVLSGPDRAMLYRVALATGLRASELASLTTRSFSLEGPMPTVAVDARFSKRRRNDVLPLEPWLADELRDYLDGREPDSRIWPALRRSAEMIRADLGAARRAWLASAPSEEERERRHASEHLQARDKAGRTLDFHALRHTAITRWASSIKSPKTVQSLARHSDVRLTFEVYAKCGLREQAQAIASLPRIAARPAIQTPSGAA